MIHNMEAEQSVLGAILLDEAVMEKSRLKSEFFHANRHQKIFAAIAKVHQRGEPVTIVTVTTELGKKDIQAVGGVGYLSELAASVPTLETFGHHQRLVLEAYRYRKMSEHALRYRESE